MKIHGLRPSEREKTRYIVFMNHSGKGVATVEQAIKDAVVYYIGVKGLAESGLYVVTSHSDAHTIAVRCGAKQVPDVLEAVRLADIDLESTKVTGLLSHIKGKHISGESRHRVFK